MTSKKKRTKGRRRKESVRTWLRLLSCEALIEQKLRTLFRQRFSITLPQFDVLSELEHATEPLTMTRLSQELMVSNGNVTGVIDRLEKSGLVTRTRAQNDRRVQYIELTEHGRTQFIEMADHHAHWVEGLFADLTLSDMSELQALLFKARSSIVKT